MSRAIIPAQPGWRVVVLRLFAPGQEITEAAAWSLPDAAVLARLLVRPLVAWRVASKRGASPLPVSTAGIADERAEVAVIVPAGAFDGVLLEAGALDIGLVLRDDAAAVVWARGVLADHAAAWDCRRLAIEGGDADDDGGDDALRGEYSEPSPGAVNIPNSGANKPNPGAANIPNPAASVGRGRGRPAVGAGLGALLAKIGPEGVPLDAFAQACRSEGIAAAARVAVPVAMLDAHQSIPPGWWFSDATMGSTSAAGLATLIAHGQQGVTIGYRNADGTDHRRLGIDAFAWATIATHEALHVCHALLIGLGPAHLALFDPNRLPGEEIEGFAAVAGLVHLRLTGKRLPDHYDGARWPLHAPGMEGFLARIAETVAPLAVPPARAERPCTEDEWLEEQARSFTEDINNLLRARAAAAAWRAACAEPVA